METFDKSVQIFISFQFYYCFAWVFELVVYCCCSCCYFFSEYCMDICFTIISLSNSFHQSSNSESTTKIWRWKVVTWKWTQKKWERYSKVLCGYLFAVCMSVRIINTTNFKQAKCQLTNLCTPTKVAGTLTTVWPWTAMLKYALCIVDCCISTWK